MKYMGSKRRIIKELIPLFQLKSGDIYVEPFVGGGNSIEQMQGVIRKGFDSHPGTIGALKTIRDKMEILPSSNLEFTESDYMLVKKDVLHPLHSYVGYCLSYAGKWWGGWCRDSAGKRDYVAESYRNAMRQSTLLQGVLLDVQDYKTLDLHDCVVYCDPPYKGTTKYGKGNGFDSDEFWDWARQLSKNNRVFVSEYEAPSDFHCIWEKEQVSSLTKATGSKKAIEKLFRI